jgi:hypothetical protein
LNLLYDNNFIIIKFKKLYYFFFHIVALNEDGWIKNILNTDLDFIKLLLYC